MVAIWCRNLACAAPVVGMATDVAGGTLLEFVELDGSCCAGCRAMLVIVNADAPKWTLEFVGLDGALLLAVCAPPIITLFCVQCRVAEKLHRSHVSIALLLGTVLLHEDTNPFRSSLYAHGLYDRARLTVVFQATWKLLIYGAVKQDLYGVGTPWEYEVKTSWAVGTLLASVCDRLDLNFDSFDVALTEDQDHNLVKMILDVRSTIADVLFDGARITLVTLEQ